MSENATPLIEPCAGWKCGDGLYPILRDAQRAGLIELLKSEPKIQDSPSLDVIADCLIVQRNHVLAILSLEAPKERKKRADAGRPRTKKIAPVAPATPQPNPPAVESTVTGSGKYKGK